MTGATSTIVDHERGGIAWRESGSHASGVPMLLLHGLTGSRLSWEPQLRALGIDRRVAAWDLPGYGASAAVDPAHGFRGLADAVARWCDLLGVDRVHLVGLSFGGMIAQYTVLTEQGSARLDSARPDYERALDLALKQHGGERLLSALVAKPR